MAVKKREVAMIGIPSALLLTFIFSAGGMTIKEKGTVLFNFQRYGGNQAICKVTLDK